MRNASTPSGSGITVEVVVLGEEVKNLFMETGCTVADCLEKAGYDVSSTVKVNGNEVDSADHPENGDRLVVTNKVKGGRA